MSRARLSLRLWLWTAVVAFVILPVAAGGLECERVASDEAYAAQHSGTRGSCVPPSVYFAFALVGPDAVYAGTRIFALGLLLTAPMLGAALALELRHRRRSDPKAKPSMAPLAVLATGSAAGVVLFGLGLMYHLSVEHRREEQRACAEEDIRVKQAWKAYQPKDLNARGPVATVAFDVGYYDYDEVCRAAREVPPDPGDPAYTAAMEATERLWKRCHGRNAKPFCTRAP